MQQRRKWFSVGLLCLWCILIPRALGQRYNFKFYGEDEGLQNLSVQTVLQDRSGFLWAGTQNGLYRYDGSRFTAFTKSEGLPGTRIEALYESTDGTLWVNTDGGLARRTGQRFEAVSSLLTHGVTGRQGIASDHDGRLYLATVRGLVVGAPSPKGMQFTLEPRPARVDIDSIFSVYTGPSGSVWYGCGNGICVLDHGRAREAGADHGLPPDRWDAILADLDGNLWLRSATRLYKRPAGSDTFEFSPICRTPTIPIRLWPWIPPANSWFPLIAA